MINDARLQVTTPGDREIAMTRTFDAPRRMVWDAYTRPELIRRWLLGPPGWSMPVCEVDLRVGGTFRFVWTKDGGHEMGMSGVYREIVAPERLVNTEAFDQPWYEGEAEATVTLTEAAGRTTIVTLVRYASREVRDGVLKSGMESGVAASYDRLAEILASMPAR